MFPIQVILLLMTVAFYASYDHSPGALPARPWMIVLSVVATHTLVVLFAGQFCRRQVRRVHVGDVDLSQVTPRLEKTMGMLRWLTVLLAAGQLWLGGWGALVMGEPAQTPGAWGLGGWRGVLLPHFIFLFPAVATWLFLWMGEYRVDEAVKSRTLPFRLARLLPTHESPTLGQYLWMKSRHNFYLFIPMGVMTAVQSLAERYRGWNSWLPEIVSLVMLGVVLATLPFMLTRVWSTETMIGDLRGRLDAIARRFRIRFADIRIWRTFFMIPNAAVVGNMPRARYFIMTDALLESLSDPQLEAVFAHEVGHAYHRHVWWYLFALAGGSSVAMGLSLLASLGIAALPAWTHAYEPEASGLIQLLLMAAFLKWGFGKISWQCEHQADWFAVKCVAEDKVKVVESLAVTPVSGTFGGEMVGEGDSAAGARISELSTTVAVREVPLGLAGGAEIFSSALYELVHMSNRSVDRGNWMHPSPSRRKALLEDLARDPAKVAAFERQMWWTRAWIVMLVVVGGAATAIAMVVVPG